MLSANFNIAIFLRISFYLNISLKLLYKLLLNNVSSALYCCCPTRGIRAIKPLRTVYYLYIYNVIFGKKEEKKYRYKKKSSFSECVTAAGAPWQRFFYGVSQMVRFRSLTQGHVIIYSPDVVPAAAHQPASSEIPHVGYKYIYVGYI